MGSGELLLGHGDGKLDVHAHNPTTGDQQRTSRTEDADQCPRVQGGERIMDHIKGVGCSALLGVKGGGGFLAGHIQV